MAYFANGTEGMRYEAEFCENCIHYGTPDEGCPVMMLHMIWNYDACNGKDKPESSVEHMKFVVLNSLIPRDKGTGNEQCKMFVRKAGQ